MNDTVEERAVILGEYIVENRATVRAAAKVFSVSKSTVHMDCLLYTSPSPRDCS